MSMVCDKERKWIIALSFTMPMIGSGLLLDPVSFGKLSVPLRTLCPDISLVVCLIIEQDVVQF
jgi:hypothetical protein